jgi:hypothetical protein
MDYTVCRNHLDSFCLSIAIRVMAVNWTRLAQNVLCKALATSTALLTQSSSWLVICPMACYFRILLYPVGFRHWYCGMLLSYIAVSCGVQTLLLWHVTFVYCCVLRGFRHCYCGMLLSYIAVSCGFRHRYCGMLLSYTSVFFMYQTPVLSNVTFVYFCILQVWNTITVACYFRILLYLADFRQWYCGMLLSYTSAFFKIQTMVLRHVTFVHFCILQVTDTGTVECYFRILLYTAGFRHCYCGMLLSYTFVFSKLQTLLLCHVTLVYFYMLHVSDTVIVECYFGILLYPVGLGHCYCGMLLSYTSVSCSFETLLKWYVILVYFCISMFQTLLLWHVTFV